MEHIYLPIVPLGDTEQRSELNLHIVQAGPLDGPLVILLHGFPEFWYGWRHQIEPLAEAGYRVIVPDQRGYNLSDKPKGVSAYRMDVLAGDIIGLMNALNRENAILTGHDWGGLIAWVAAVLHPDRVKKLAVLNAPYPPAVLRTMLTHPKQIVRSSYIYFFQINGLAEALLRNNNWEVLVKSMRRSSQPGAFSHEDLERYQEAWWRKDAMTSMLNWYRALFRRPFRLPLQPHLRTPTLLLWGARDTALGRELAEASIELCENGRLIFFEDATHWIQHEKVQQVNQYLLDFFAGD